MDNISVYFCNICERYTGLFYRWDEIDDEAEPVCCSICEHRDIKFIKDISLEGK